MASRESRILNSEIDALVVHLLTFPPSRRMARLRQIESDWRTSGKDTFRMMGLLQRIGERLLTTLPRQVGE